VVRRLKPNNQQAFLGLKPIPSGSVDQGASLIIHHGSFDLRKKILMALPLPGYPSYDML
jgi:hypothetical protein